MAILNKEEFLNAIRMRVGDDETDEALNFIRDMNETYEALSANDNEDWKSRYEANDAEWRKRYKETFFNSASDDDMNKEPEDDKPLTFNTLFKEK